MAISSSKAKHNHQIRGEILLVGEVRAPLRAFHRFRSIAMMSSFESVQFTLAYTAQCAPHRRLSFFKSVQF